MAGSAAARTTESAPISAGCVMGRPSPQAWPRNQTGMCLLSSVLAPPGCAATGAQAAGEVRADLTVDDIKMLVMGCSKASNAPDAGEAATRRLLSVVAAGLRPDR